MPTNPTPDKPSLLSLQRGLEVLDRLIRSGNEPARFGEIKAVLPGVQDSTLARLLKAMEVGGYLERDADVGYRIGARVRSWSLLLNRTGATFLDRARSEVGRLAKDGGESVCLAVLNGEKIGAVCSRSVEGGITVLDEGSILHFEPDHAGALAVLSLLEARTARRLMAGPYGRFAEGETLEQSLALARTDGPELLDKSRERPGVCRLARGFRCGDMVGSVFYCLTVEACGKKQPRLSRLLDEACRAIEGR